MIEITPRLKVLAMTALLACSGCGGATYEWAPDSIAGDWVSAENYEISVVRVRSKTVTVLERTGFIRTCSIQSVNISYSFSSESKSINVRCAPIIIGAHGEDGVCQSPYGVKFWRMHFYQAAESDKFADIKEYMETSCDPGDRYASSFNWVKGLYEKK